MATKGNSFRGLDMQELEGGVGGGMSGGMSSAGRSSGSMASKVATGALGLGALSGVKKINDQQNANEEARKPKAEKTPTERAKEDAKEMKLQERTNKAAEEASKNMAKGGKISSASSRADGCACRGKTKGKMY